MRSEAQDTELLLYLSVRLEGDPCHGAWERGSDKGLLCPGRLKLSAPSSKPGTEGLDEVWDRPLYPNGLECAV